MMLTAPPLFLPLGGPAHAAGPTPNPPKLWFWDDLGTDSTPDDVRYQDASPTPTPFEVAAPRRTNQVSGRKSALRRPKTASMPSASRPVFDFSIQADTSWRDDTDRNRA